MDFILKYNMCAKHLDAPCLNCTTLIGLKFAAELNTYMRLYSESVCSLCFSCLVTATSFVCLFLYKNKYGTCVRMYVITINDGLKNTLSKYLATYSV